MEEKLTYTKAVDNLRDYFRMFALSVGELKMYEFMVQIHDGPISIGWADFIDTCDSSLNPKMFESLLDYCFSCLTELHELYHIEAQEISQAEFDEDHADNLDHLTARKYKEGFEVFDTYVSMLILLNPLFRTFLSKEIEMPTDDNQYFFNNGRGSESLPNIDDVVSKDDDYASDPIKYKSIREKVRGLRLLGMMDLLNDKIPNGNNARADAIVKLMGEENQDSVRKAIEAVMDEDVTKKRYGKISLRLKDLGAINLLDIQTD